MKRDLDLIRELMLKLEALQVPPGGWVEFFEWDEEIAIEGRSEEEIGSHLHMIFDAGLAFYPYASPIDMSGKWSFSRLTPAGHDFADSVRDSDTWKRTKAGATKVGNWSFGFVVEIAKAVGKQKLAEVIGLPL